MAEKTIKFRLFHFYTEEEVPGTTGTSLIERHANFGETVDLEREEDIARGERLGAFFTDSEMKDIQNGTYDGAYAELLAARMSSIGGHPDVPPFSLNETPGGEHRLAIMNMTADEIHEYINANDLGVADTVAMVGTDAELAEKVLDAENMAGSPRAGVLSGLEGITVSPGATGEGDGGSGGDGGEGESGEDLPDDAPAKNASKDDWKAYAELEGIEFGEDATRDDIIAAVIEAQQ